MAKFGPTLLRLANAIADHDDLDASAKRDWLDDLKQLSAAHSDDVQDMLDELSAAISSVTTAAR